MIDKRLPGFLQTRPEAQPTSLPFRVRAAGRTHDEPMHSTRGTHHADAMLTVVVSGRGAYHRRGEVLPVSGGMVGLVMPGADVGILMAEPGDPYDHFYCRFAGDLALQTAAAVRSNWKQSFVSDPQAVERLTPLMQQMSQQGSGGESVESLRVVDALLAQALAWLSSSPREATESITHGSIERYLRDHLAMPFNLTHAAEHFRVSEAHLCRTARRLLDSTLQREAQRLKIEWAKVLLQRSTLSVAEVAGRVGYRDPLYFSRVFSRTVGIPATRWRDLQTQGDASAA